MKLTKNWIPLLLIYLLVGGLAGIILSDGSCSCEDSNNGWIIVGLLLGVIIWFFHQSSLQSEPELESKDIKKKIKRRKKKK